MLDNIAQIIVAAEKKGLPIDKQSLQALVETLFLAHIITVLVKGAFYLTACIIICWTFLQL